MSESYFDEQGNLQMVQYAVRIKEKGVDDDNLIKNCVDVSLDNIKKAISNINDVCFCSNEDNKIMFEYRSLNIKGSYVKDRLGSLEFIAGSKDNAEGFIERIGFLS